MAWSSNSERPEMENNLQYHIRCSNGDIHKNVLLPGDPERCDEIANTWDEKNFIAFNREYKTFSGTYSNIKLNVCSTGIGGSSTAIAVEELANLGAENFIRVGTCGAIQNNIRCGDLIICTGAVRFDGASTEYVDIAYPAVADYKIVNALVKACEQLNYKYHTGISCSTATFHCGQSRKGFKDFSQSWHANKIHDMQKAGVLNFEMEAATIFTLAGIYGLKAGAIFTVVADRNNNKFECSGVDKSINAANLAFKIFTEDK